MTYPEFELFSGGTKSMLEGELLLIEEGAASLPKLDALFSGEAKNGFGVQYRSLGMPLQCALEVVVRLGAIAKPLESHLRRLLETGDRTAAMALGALGALEPASILALVSAMTIKGKHVSVDLNAESAVALIKCGQASPPAFLEARSKFPDDAFLGRIIDKAITCFEGTG